MAKKQGGRPSLYSDELAKRICELVSTHTVGIARLCKMYPDLPDKETIRLWRLYNKEFFALYARAKVVQGDLLAEDTLDISDDNTDNSKDAIARDRLRVDTRKWLASKLVPKLYGDRVTIEDTKDSKEKHDEMMSLRKQLKKKHEKEF